MLYIRPLVPSDSGQVLLLNAESQPKVAALDRAELDRLQSISHDHIVAEDGKLICGYLLSFAREDAYDGEEFVILRTLISQPFVYIDQIAILGSLQRSGIGRRLYGVLEHTAMLRGACFLCCEVNTAPPNPGSLAFHRRLGFDSVGSFATRDGRNVELLRKRLSVAAQQIAGADA